MAKPSSHVASPMQSRFGKQRFTGGFRVNESAKGKQLGKINSFNPSQFKKTQHKG